MNNNQSGNENQSQPEAQNRSNDEQSANDNQASDRSKDNNNNSNNQSGTDNQASSNESPNTSGTPTGSRPPSQASNNKSRPASQASNRPQSQVSNNNNNNNNNSKSRPASQASNRPQSQASNKPKPSQSRKSSSSPSISRPRQSPRGRSRTPRSISAASQGGSDEDRDGAVTPTDNPGTFADQEDLPDVDEEEGEGDNAIETTSKGKDDGEKKTKRRRRGKKKSFGVNAWPHGDNPGPMEPPHGVNDWPYEEDSEGVGTSGKVLKRPKGVRDFSPAYAPSDAGSNASAGTDYSAVSGLSLGDWERDSLPGVDSWPYGDNPGIMVKPLDHWGQPLKNPDGTLIQKENPTGLPDYEELRGMDLDSREDHIIALKLEIDLDVAVEINARIHGDITLALLM